MLTNAAAMAVTATYQYENMKIRFYYQIQIQKKCKFLIYSKTSHYQVH
jgi:hypothetical protein